MIVGRRARWRYGKRVQIPRCRATVSEDTRGRSLGISSDDFGRAWEGRRKGPDSNRVLTRKPGDRRKPSPTTLSRVKENGMRSSVVVFVLAVFLVVLLSGSASAEVKVLKVRVLDPQSAAVAGAQVSLLRAGDATILATQSTSPEGDTTFHIGTAGLHQIRVLAPGFAVETVDVSSQTEVTVNLRLANASETVVVSATRTPVPGEAAGAEVDVLGGEQLSTMRPIAADDAMRFLPGVVVNSAGQRGGISSLFVRGGESTYNKVIVDGVAVDTPGQTFDFGTLSLAQADRLEFVRGAQSTLYGSDAMTSVIQVWTRNGSTPVPEFRFGADGGNFGTANGYASLAGEWRRFDYNLFGDQFVTNGQGINDAYSDSLQGANVGMAITDKVALRVRARHSNSYTGVPGEWSFNGFDPPVKVNGVTQPLQPDPSEYSHQNSILGSVELSVSAPSGWQHRLTAFDYLYRYNEVNLNGDPARVDGYGFQFDFPSHEYDHINRVGFEYQGDYSERTWAHSTFGYRIENENGTVGDLFYPPSTSGQRLNNDAYLQQQLTLGRLSVIAGGRFVHSSLFGNTGVPPGRSNSAGVARWRLLFWNAAAFFLRNGIHGARPLPDFRQPSILRSESRPVAGAHASIRGRSRTEVCSRGAGL